MMFPSSVQVFRHQIIGTHRVAVHHGGYITVAGGATASEAEEKALRWTWESINKRKGLWAALARLDGAVSDLTETIRG
jgi:hypothetical protein